MKVIIQTVKDKQVFTMDKARDFKKHIEHYINNGMSIKITQDAKTYLINPRNIVWIECINDKED